jgi:predicted amidohydrolase YtcJ
VTHSPAASTAFINADVTTLDASMPRAGGVLVTDGKIERVFEHAPTGLGSDVKLVDCEGGAIIPGLHDCHVHLTDTGLLAGAHDVRDCPDVAAIIRRVRDLYAARMRSMNALYAGNYDEALIAERRPPLRSELDAAAPDQPVLLTRVDGHSCVVNSAVLASFDIGGLEGVERDDAGMPTGRLRAAANYAAQDAVLRSLGQEAKSAADERAATIALRNGITTAHNVIITDEPFEQLQEHYRRDASLPLRVLSKSCSTDVRKVKRLGRRLFGGDIFVDGSIGSRTAAVSRQYRDVPGDGTLYLGHETLYELFDEAAEARLSLGVHAIGDRAIEAAVAAWEAVIARRGRLDDVRPSIDHFEIASADQIQRAARCGILLSMQPAFDYLWGGTEGMYAQRFGVAGALEMNAFGSAKGAGCTVCGGSDSPVTPFSALLGVHALVNHHVAEQRFTIDEALRAYTTDAAKLSFDEGRRGVLAPGFDADFVLLEKPLGSIPPEEIKDARVLMTVIAGEIRYDLTT